MYTHTHIAYTHIYIQTYTHTYSQTYGHTHRHKEWPSGLVG